MVFCPGSVPGFHSSKGQLRLRSVPRCSFCFAGAPCHAFGCFHLVSGWKALAGPSAIISVPAAGGTFGAMEEQVPGRCG